MPGQRRWCARSRWNGQYSSKSALMMSARRVRTASALPRPIWRHRCRVGRRSCADTTPATTSPSGEGFGLVKRRNRPLPDLAHLWRCSLCLADTHGTPAKPTKSKAIWTTRHSGGSNTPPATTPPGSGEVDRLPSGSRVRGRTCRHGRADLKVTEVKRTVQARETILLPPDPRCWFAESSGLRHRPWQRHQETRGGACGCRLLIGRLPASSRGGHDVLQASPDRRERRGGPRGARSRRSGDPAPGMPRTPAAAALGAHETRARRRASGRAR